MVCAVTSPRTVSGPGDSAAEALSSSAFEILCEIEPATGPDLTRVRRQIAVLTGRRPVPGPRQPPRPRHRVEHRGSSGGGGAGRGGGGLRQQPRPQSARLSARSSDRGRVRRQRVPLVHGDEPAVGTRSTDLSVRKMIDEARAYAERDFKVGATLRCGASVPAWKQTADFLLVQVNYDVDALLEWRATVEYPGRLLAGVMVMASADMARRISADVPQINVPQSLDLGAGDRSRCRGRPGRGHGLPDPRVRCFRRRAPRACRPLHPDGDETPCGRPCTPPLTVEQVTAGR